VTGDALTYAARLRVDYPAKLDRITTFLRLIWIVPIAIILSLITASGGTRVVTQTGETIRHSSGGIVGGLVVATALMIVVRRRYPRWWFDFSRELVRFAGRVGAYAALLTDQYPSTVDEQSVHLEIDYPNVEQDLNRWLPLVKWILAIPHYLVLAVLFVIAVFVIVIAWFAILFTGGYPRGLFDFVVGVGRWALRVQAYAFLLVTDRYPPFSMS
jgi:membrane protein YdbS with pleckstrin-like domain